MSDDVIHSDPFAVFDDNDEELVKLRDPENGLLAFHGGTENALLLYVKNSVQLDGLSCSEKLVLMIDLIDRFCYERHWMMNIGPEKGPTLEDFLDECLQVHRASDKSDACFTFVELGTYCGYSCLRFLHRLLQTLSIGQFHIFTVDVNLATIQVAKGLVAMAGLEECVTFLHLGDAQLARETKKLSSLLMDEMKERLQVQSTPRIDFLFLDHDKSGYLPDLQQLELQGLIQKGTYVAADNVIFHGIDDYRNYMGELETKEIVVTRLVEGLIEYVNDQTRQQEHLLSDVRDGIELTIYNKNPIR